MRSRNTLAILSWVSLGLIFLSFVLTGFQLIRYSQMRSNYPLDLTIGNIPVGGLNSTQAAERLIRAYGIPIEMVYGDSVIQVSPTSIGFSLNLETMLAAADLQRHALERMGVTRRRLIDAVYVLDIDDGRHV